MFCNYCGKELADGSKFCPQCGGVLSEEQTSNTEPQMNYYQQPAYASMNAAYNNAYDNSYDSTYRRYKKRVVPFKVVAGVMNLISLIPMAIIALAFLGASTGEDGFYVITRFDSDLKDSLMACGVAGLVVCLLLLILGIVGLCAPAKGGVICNLIATVLSCSILIWALILNGELGDFVSYFGSNFIDDFVLGMNIFIIVTAVFQLISLTMCIIGLCVKKNK